MTSREVILPFGEFANPEASPDRAIEGVRGTSSEIAVLPSSPDAIGRRAAALAAIAHRNSEAFLIRFRWPGNGEALRVAVGLVNEGAWRLGKPPLARSMDISRFLDAWLAFLWPDAQPATCSKRLASLTGMSLVRPVATAATMPRRKNGPCDALAHTQRSDEPMIEHVDRRTFDLNGALGVLAAHGPGELVLRVAPFVLDARSARAVKVLSDRYLGMDADGVPTNCDETLVQFLSDLHREGRGVRIDPYVKLVRTSDRLLVDLVAWALFGAPADPARPAADHVDLRSIWPVGWELPTLLPSQDEASAMARRCNPQRRQTSHRATGNLELGKAVSGERIFLSARDRARHLYIVGATGTGKSTLLLNLIRQDISAGEGVIVVDPHGDLADAARGLVPDSRRSQLIWADLSDPGSALGLNILEGQGGVPELERNYVCNQLITLFRRVLYRGVPEAFGPMFETYFRNALMLLMDGGGPKTSLMDFERIFHDEQFSYALIARCDDEKVREFWLEIATKATSDETRLASIAPYIVSKLTQLTGNPLIKALISGDQSAWYWRRSAGPGQGCG